AFNLSVTSVNTAPTISGSPTTTVAQGVPYSFRPTASDADGSTLTFSIANRPSWMSFNTSTGLLAGTPSNANVGSYSNIVISVSDGTVSAALPAFTLTVTNVNDAPTISGSPATSVAQGAAYAFQPTASDADGNTLTFSIANRPSWMSFNTSTGRLSGTPTNSNVGSYSNIVISVSDGTVSTALPAFTLTVTNVNDAPTISGSPATSVAQGAAYAFQPTASDADGNTLTFSIANRPSWASFNTSTGRLSGTPTNSNVGSYASIVISVSDGTVSTALPAFTLTVTNVNDAPTISGSPATSVDAGVAYSFTPSAVDLDGNTLTFSIANRPAWASFNTSTGRLSGTPTEANVATYGNIVITVSDGQASAQLAPFSITVNSAQPASSDVTLSWVAPSTRTDGTALSLSDITGFRIHYGTSAGNYTSSVSVNDPTATTYTLQDMAPATYYFTVTAIDADGQESGYSSAVNTTVQ
ncbi:MAG TPA: putative Ig domain-containing protein, partial [Gammaproteobacteria bacterium]